MATNATKHVSETLKTMGLLGKTAQIRIAAVQALEARAKTFKEMDSVNALKYIFDEADPLTKRYAEQSLINLVRGLHDDKQ
jgi:hypothetical protein